MPGKILIVDDEANIIISLEFLMQQAGYTVAIARNGEEAFAQVEHFQPDLVLLDVMLPGINGFDVLQRLRQQPASREMFVIMLTAKGREVEVTKGLALGADAYITKPFSTRDLLAEVRRHLDRREDHEALTN